MGSTQTEGGAEKLEVRAVSVAVHGLKLREGQAGKRGEKCVNCAKQTNQNKKMVKFSDVCLRVVSIAVKGQIVKALFKTKETITALTLNL